MKLTYCVLLAALVFACSPKDNREGTHTADGDYVHYSDSVTGWSARYPKSWHVLTPREIAALEGRGQEALEVAAGALELNHRNMAWLKKDDFNSFTSNYEAFNPDTDGSFDDNEQLLYSTMEEAYRLQGIQFDSKQGKAMIDGLEFSTWESTIYTPDRSSVLMSQVMYGRLIGSRVAITLNINYNNTADRDTLLTIIESGKFSIRD